MKEWDRWATAAGLVLTFIGLIFAAHTIRQSTQQITLATANDLRTHLIDGARHITAINGGDVAKFDFNRMLFIMDDYINVTHDLELGMHNEALVERTLVALADGYCPTANGQLIADQAEVSAYKDLAKWARERTLEVKCP